MKHLLSAVQALVAANRVRVFGSSALLASFPELGEPSGPLEKTFDAGLVIEPRDEQLAAMLHEAVGEGSLFAQRTGYHADILRADVAATLPPGWEARLVVCDPTRDVTALAPEDLMVAKLRTGDVALRRELLDRGLVKAKVLRERLDRTPLEEREIGPVYRRFREITGEQPET